MIFPTRYLSISLPAALFFFLETSTSPSVVTALKADPFFQVEGVMPIVDNDSSKPTTSAIAEESEINGSIISSPSSVDKSVTNFVFSDVDGTLVHYPDSDADVEEEEDNKILYLPPSSTGMRGVISSKTLKLCQTLRREHNVKLVLVSGMRTSTLLKRLPYLPKADAYCSEAGGRIFYASDVYPEGEDEGDGEEHGTFITPEPFDGATKDDLRPFGLKEDELWRSKLSLIAGTDGNPGDAMDLFLGTSTKTQIIPLEDRKAPLWNYANELRARGFSIDYKGYSNCFRVNMKQQKENVTREDFEALKTTDVSEQGLATSVNLGCIDFYPSSSGKKNCCEYLAHHFSDVRRSADSPHSTTDDYIMKRCICLCDDDNDLEMAMACGMVFLPSISSLSMKHAAKFFPDQIFIMEDKKEGITETRATERALSHALIEFQRRSGEPRIEIVKALEE